jgi:hypothetical protein
MSPLRPRATGSPPRQGQRRERTRALRLEAKRAPGVEAHRASGSGAWSMSESRLPGTQAAGAPMNGCDSRVLVDDLLKYPLGTELCTQHCRWNPLCVYL